MSTPAPARPQPRNPRLLLWLRLLRLEFVLVALMPVGTALLLSRTMLPLDARIAALTIIGGGLFLVATNLVDEYWDFVQHRGPEPLEGGSGLLARGALTPEAVLRVGQAGFVACAGGGLYLAFQFGWPVALLTLIGLVIGYGYAAPPLRLAYRGLPAIWRPMRPRPSSTASPASAMPTTSPAAYC